jgi:uncharacterized membrane protein
MMFKDLIGLATMVVVVAGLSAALYRGQATAQVIGAIGTSFTNAIGAATLSSAGTGSN